MGAINIENVDEQVLKSIRLRARSHGRSFEDEVKAVLAEAARPPKMTPEQFAEEARRIREMTPKGVKQTDSTEIIRELRDRGYSRGLPPSPSEEVDAAAPPDRVAEARRIRAMTKGWSPETDSVAVIRELRNRDR